MEVSLDTDRIERIIGLAATVCLTAVMVFLVTVVLVSATKPFHLNVKYPNGSPIERTTP